MGDLRYYGDQTEDMLLCRKGRPELYWAKRRGNIFKTTSKAYYPEGSFDHATQKPEALATTLIPDCCPRHGLVVDFYTGSGTFPVVCKREGYHYLAFEIDPDVADRARERVRNTQPPLFVMQTEQTELEI